MAEHRIGEDFSDDGFDNITLDAFIALENDAIQFTQAQRPPDPAAATSSDYGDEFEQDDLDDAVVVDESRSTPALNPAFQGAEASKVGHAGHSQLQQRRTTQTLSSRQRPTDTVPPRNGRPAGLKAPSAIVQHESMTVEQGSQPLTGTDNRVDSLQRQIEELLRERSTLRDDLNAKAGEIAIVRSQQEKRAREYERELISIRKLNEDKLARQKKELDAARISEQHASTERDFYKQDAAEAERARRLNKAKDLEKKEDANNTTPKKKKSFAHRDGFDDNEIEMLSPSRGSPSKVKKTTNSPSKAGKRKRKPDESPAGALEVVNLEDQPPEPHNQSLLDEAVLSRLAVQDDRFNFLGTMLDHRVDSKHLRTIEELSKYKLPSNPAESFQSVILGEIPGLGYRKPISDLPIEFCDILISLWSKCLEETYLEPVYLLIDMLTLALELKTTAVTPHIIDTLVPLIQSTVDPIVVPLFKKQTPIEQFEEHIDTTQCFSLLHLTALGCMCEHQFIVRFWKLMRYDIVFVMLSTEQRLADTRLMLDLLSTSIFRDRVAAAVGDEVQDPMIYGEFINKLTKLLVEVQFKPRSTDRLETEEVSNLRLHILQLMTGMTRSPFAGKLMAMHRDAIGRLVQLISDELDELYDYKPGRNESSRIISLATRLLYHLVIKYDDVIDMQKKLSVIHGGSQKYLLCLTRLNFSEEDLILESGIDSDIAACALELLELGVTPEEGDAIQSAFSSQ